MFCSGFGRNFAGTILQERKTKVIDSYYAFLLRFFSAYIFRIVGNCRALDYGALGMVVGHEITHGFDKEGISRFSATEFLDTSNRKKEILAKILSRIITSNDNEKWCVASPTI